MDELNLYDDLDEFQEEHEKKSKELQDAESKYQESLKTIEELREENKKLKKNIQRIELGFQSLLDTARAEIRRKDKEIERLRKEKDDICFRRKIPNKSERPGDNQLLLDPIKTNPFKSKSAPEVDKETATTSTNVYKEKKQVDIHKSQDTRNDKRDHSRDHTRNSSRDDKYHKNDKTSHSKDESKSAPEVENETATTSTNVFKEKKQPDIHTSRDTRNDKRDHSRDHTRHTSRDDKYHKNDKTSHSKDEYKDSRSRYRENEKETSYISSRVNRNRSRERYDNSRYAWEKSSTCLKNSERYDRRSDRSRSKDKDKYEESRKSERNRSNTTKTNSSSRSPKQNEPQLQSSQDSDKSSKEHYQDLGDKIQVYSNSSMENPFKRTDSLIKEITEISSTFKANTETHKPKNSKKSNESDKCPEKISFGSLKKKPHKNTKTKSINQLDKEIEHTKENSISTSNILCTPRKVALFDELFGISPSFSSTTATNSETGFSVLSNIKGILAKTPQIEVISSATTSPEDYTDASSCGVTPKDCLVEAVSSDITTPGGSRDINEDDVPTPKRNDIEDIDIDECFVPTRAEGEVVKTIACLDVIEIVDDDDDKEEDIQFVEIPGLDICGPKNKSHSNILTNETIPEKIKILEILELPNKESSSVLMEDIVGNNQNALTEDNSSISINAFEDISTNLSEIAPNPVCLNENLNIEDNCQSFDSFRIKAKSHIEQEPEIAESSVKTKYPSKENTLTNIDSEESSTIPSNNAISTLSFYDNLKCLKNPNIEQQIPADSENLETDTKPNAHNIEVPPIVESILEAKFTNITALTTLNEGSNSELSITKSSLLDVDHPHTTPNSTALELNDIEAQEQDTITKPETSFENKNDKETLKHDETDIKPKSLNKEVPHIIESISVTEAPSTSTLAAAYKDLTRGLSVSKSVSLGADHTHPTSDSAALKTSDLEPPELETISKPETYLKRKEDETKQDDHYSNTLNKSNGEDVSVVDESFEIQVNKTLAKEEDEKRTEKQDEISSTTNMEETSSKEIEPCSDALDKSHNDEESSSIQDNEASPEENNENRIAEQDDNSYDTIPKSNMDESLSNEQINKEKDVIFTILDVNDTLHKSNNDEESIEFRDSETSLEEMNTLDIIPKSNMENLTSSNESNKEGEVEALRANEVTINADSVSEIIDPSDLDLDVEENVTSNEESNKDDNSLALKEEIFFKSQHNNTIPKPAPYFEDNDKNISTKCAESPPDSNHIPNLEEESADEVLNREAEGSNSTAMKTVNIEIPDKDTVSETGISLNDEESTKIENLASYNESKREEDCHSEVLESETSFEKNESLAENSQVCLNISAITEQDHDGTTEKLHSPILTDDSKAQNKEEIHEPLAEFEAEISDETAKEANSQTPETNDSKAQFNENFNETLATIEAETDNDGTINEPTFETDDSKAHNNEKINDSLTTVEAETEQDNDGTTKKAQSITFETIDSKIQNTEELLEPLTSMKAEINDGTTKEENSLTPETDDSKIQNNEELYEPLASIKAEINDGATKKAQSLTLETDDSKAQNNEELHEPLASIEGEISDGITKEANSLTLETGYSKAQNNEELASIEAEIINGTTKEAHSLTPETDDSKVQNNEELASIEAEIIDGTTMEGHSLILEMDDSKTQNNVELHEPLASIEAEINPTKTTAEETKTNSDNCSDEHLAKPITQFDSKAKSEDLNSENSIQKCQEETTLGQQDDKNVRDSSSEQLSLLTNLNNKQNDDEDVLATFSERCASIDDEEKISLKISGNDPIENFVDYHQIGPEYKPEDHETAIEITSEDLDKISVEESEKQLKPLSTSHIFTEEEILSLPLEQDDLGKETDNNKEDVETTDESEENKQSSSATAKKVVETVTEEMDEDIETQFQSKTVDSKVLTISEISDSDGVNKEKLRLGSNDILSASESSDVTNKEDILIQIETSSEGFAELYEGPFLDNKEDANVLNMSEQTEDEEISLQISMTDTECSIMETSITALDANDKELKVTEISVASSTEDTLKNDSFSEVPSTPTEQTKNVTSPAKDRKEISLIEKDSDIEYRSDCTAVAKYVQSPIPKHSTDESYDFVKTEDNKDETRSKTGGSDKEEKDIQIVESPAKDSSDETKTCSSKNLVTEETTMDKSKQQVSETPAKDVTEENVKTTASISPQKSVPAEELGNNNNKEHELQEEELGNNNNKEHELQMAENPAKVYIDEKDETETKEKGHTNKYRSKEDNSEQMDDEVGEPETTDVKAVSLETQDIETSNQDNAKVTSSNCVESEPNENQAEKKFCKAVSTLESLGISTDSNNRIPTENNDTNKITPNVPQSPKSEDVPTQTVKDLESSTECSLKQSNSKGEAAMKSTRQLETETSGPKDSKTKVNNTSEVNKTLISEVTSDTLDLSDKENLTEINEIKSKLSKNFEETIQMLVPSSLVSEKPVQIQKKVKESEPKQITHEDNNSETVKHDSEHIVSEETTKDSELKGTQTVTDQGKEDNYAVKCVATDVPNDKVSYDKHNEIKTQHSENVEKHSDSEKIESIKVQSDSEDCDTSTCNSSNVVGCSHREISKDKEDEKKDKQDWAKHIEKQTLRNPTEVLATDDSIKSSCETFAVKCQPIFESSQKESTEMVEEDKETFKYIEATSLNDKEVSTKPDGSKNKLSGNLVGELNVKDSFKLIRKTSDVIDLTLLEDSHRGSAENIEGGSPEDSDITTFRGNKLPSRCSEIKTKTTSPVLKKKYGSTQHPVFLVISKKVSSPVLAKEGESTQHPVHLSTCKEVSPVLEKEGEITHPLVTSKEVSSAVLEKEDDSTQHSVLLDTSKEVSFPVLEKEDKSTQHPVLLATSKEVSSPVLEKEDESTQHSVLLATSKEVSSPVLEKEDENTQPPVVLATSKEASFAVLGKEVGCALTTVSRMIDISSNKELVAKLVPNNLIQETTVLIHPLCAIPNAGPTLEKVETQQANIRKKPYIPKGSKLTNVMNTITCRMQKTLEDVESTMKMIETQKADDKSSSNSQQQISKKVLKCKTKKIPKQKKLTAKDRTLNPMKSATEEVPIADQSLLANDRVCQLLNNKSITIVQKPNTCITQDKPISSLCNDTSEVNKISNVIVIPSNNPGSLENPNYYSNLQMPLGLVQYPINLPQGPVQYPVNIPQMCFSSGFITKVVTKEINMEGEIVEVVKLQIPDNINPPPLIKIHEISQTMSTTSCPKTHIFNLVDDSLNRQDMSNNTMSSLHTTSGPNTQVLTTVDGSNILTPQFLNNTISSLPSTSRPNTQVFTAVNDSLGKQVIPRTTQECGLLPPFTSTTINVLPTTSGPPNQVLTPVQSSFSHLQAEKAAVEYSGLQNNLLNSNIKLQIPNIPTSQSESKAMPALSAISMPTNQVLTSVQSTLSNLQSSEAFRPSVPILQTQKGADQNMKSQIMLDNYHVQQIPNALTVQLPSKAKNVISSTCLRNPPIQNVAGESSALSNKVRKNLEKPDLKQVEAIGREAEVTVKEMIHSNTLSTLSSTPHSDKQDIPSAIPAFPETVLPAKEELEFKTPQKLPSLAVHPSLTAKINLDKLVNITSTTPTSPDTYSSQIVLPSISSSSPTPSNFSGLFSKTCIPLSTSSPKEDDLNKTKRKSPHSKRKEYVLPAASVLCNVNNLENATKSKKLHWELLDNKNELTEIEDDADAVETDEELQEVKEELIENNSTSAKELGIQKKSEKYSPSETDTQTEDESLLNELKLQKLGMYKKAKLRLKKTKHLKHKIPKNVKERLKAIGMTNMEALASSIAFPRRPKGRPKKGYKTESVVTHKKRGRPSKISKEELNETPKEEKSERKKEVEKEELVSKCITLESQTDSCKNYQSESTSTEICEADKQQQEEEIKEDPDSSKASQPKSTNTEINEAVKHQEGQDQSLSLDEDSENISTKSEVKVHKSKRLQHQVDQKIKERIIADKLTKVKAQAYSIVCTKRPVGRPRKVVKLISGKKRGRKPKQVIEPTKTHEVKAKEREEDVSKSNATKSASPDIDSHKYQQEQEQATQYLSVALKSFGNSDPDSSLDGEKRKISHKSSMKILSTSVERLEISDDACNSRDSAKHLKSFETQIEECKYQDEHNTSMIYHKQDSSAEDINISKEDPATKTSISLDKKDKKLNSPNQNPDPIIGNATVSQIVSPSNKIYPSKLLSAIDIPQCSRLLQENRLLIKSDSDSEKVSSADVLSRRKICSKSKIFAKPLMKKKFKSRIKSKVINFISLQDIGIKVRPLKGHLSSCRIPKTKKEETIDGSWKLETYVELEKMDENKVYKKLETNEKEIELDLKEKEDKESEGTANKNDSREEILSPSIESLPKQDKDNADDCDVNHQPSCSRSLKPLEKEETSDYPSVLEPETTSNYIINFDDKTKTGKRKLYSPDMYDEIEENTETKTVLHNLELFSEQSREPNLVKLRRKSLHIPKTSNDSELSVNSDSVKTKCTKPRRKIINLQRRILDSSNDEEEIYNEKIVKKSPVLLIDKTKEHLKSDAPLVRKDEKSLEEHKKSMFMERTSPGFREAKTTEKTNDKSIKVTEKPNVSIEKELGKPLKGRRKSMYVESPAFASNESEDSDTRKPRKKPVRRKTIYVENPTTITKGETNTNKEHVNSLNPSLSFNRGKSVYDFTTDESDNNEARKAEAGVKLPPTVNKPIRRKSIYMDRPPATEKCDRNEAIQSQKVGKDGNPTTLLMVRDSERKETLKAPSKPMRRKSLYVENAKGTEDESDTNGKFEPIKVDDKPSCSPLLLVDTNEQELKKPHSKPMRRKSVYVERTVTTADDRVKGTDSPLTLSVGVESKEIQTKKLMIKLVRRKSVYAENTSTTADESDYKEASESRKSNLKSQPSTSPLDAVETRKVETKNQPSKIVRRKSVYVENTEDKSESNEVDNSGKIERNDKAQPLIALDVDTISTKEAMESEKSDVNTAVFPSLPLVELYPKKIYSKPVRRMSVYMGNSSTNASDTDHMEAIGTKNLNSEDLPTFSKEKAMKNNTVKNEVIEPGKTNVDSIHFPSLPLVQLETKKPQIKLVRRKSLYVENPPNNTSDSDDSKMIKPSKECLDSHSLEELESEVKETKKLPSKPLRRKSTLVESMTLKDDGKESSTAKTLPPSLTVQSKDNKNKPMRRKSVYVENISSETDDHKLLRRKSVYLESVNPNEDPDEPTITIASCTTNIVLKPTCSLESNKIKAQETKKISGKSIRTKSLFMESPTFINDGDVRKEDDKIKKTLIDVKASLEISKEDVNKASEPTAAIKSFKMRRKSMFTEQTRQLTSDEPFHNKTKIQDKKLQTNKDVTSSKEIPKMHGKSMCTELKSPQVTRQETCNESFHKKTKNHDLELQANKDVDMGKEIPKLTASNDSASTSNKPITSFKMRRKSMYCERKSLSSADDENKSKALNNSKTEVSMVEGEGRKKETDADSFVTQQKSLECRVPILQPVPNYHEEYSSDSSVELRHLSSIKRRKVSTNHPDKRNETSLPKEQVVKGVLPQLNRPEHELGLKHKDTRPDTLTKLQNKLTNSDSFSAGVHEKSLKMRKKSTNERSNLDSKAKDPRSDVVSSQISRKSLDKAQLPASTEGMVADSDASVVMSQQKTIKLRRKSLNQRRILESSSDDSDNELLLKKPALLTPIEPKTPLSTEPKISRPRKKRVVKVLSTSLESTSSNIASTSQASSCQPSPLTSPTLNHPIFNTEVSTQSSEFIASMPKTPNQQDDNKFKEIDSKLHAIFQSPQYTVDYKISRAVDNSNLLILPPPLSESQVHITLDETQDFNRENDVGSVNNSQLPETPNNLTINSTASAQSESNEVKQLSLGSSDYRFEKVSDNVINLFISRKRKRKRNT